MAKYVCFHCRAEVEIKDVNTTLTCPHCSGKIFFKQPPENKRRIVKAI